ncbi:hypothetical protein JTY60_00325 [symbiont of Argiope bruennichi]|uniref:ferritin family protein n=1 Tax=symbiont of Argiope bruennichi TaxID=2810479 RepID=UPI003DA63406
MKKFKCKVCGAIFNEHGNCPVCGADKMHVHEITDEHSGVYAESSSEKGPLKWVAEHRIGFAKDVPANIKEMLDGCFKAETSEVGMYLAMSRQAFREGYPEIGRIFEKIAFEEADHASRFCEAIGEMVYPSTKENLKKMIHGENGANHIRYEIACWAKKENDDLHDMVHEIARDEARHGKSLIGLLKRYFNEEITSEN